MLVINKLLQYGDMGNMQNIGQNIDQNKPLLDQEAGQLQFEKFNSHFEAAYDNTSKWQKLMQKLCQEYGYETYVKWLSKVAFSSFVGGVLEISSKSELISEWVSTYYGYRIKDLWETEQGATRKLEFIINQDFDYSAQTKAFAQEYAKINKSATRRPELLEENKELSYEKYLYTMSTPLDPRLNFDKFIANETNKMAFAAAKHVSEVDEPNQYSNPLVIHGGVGLGKTHLLQSIAHYIEANHKGKRVFYLSAEKFLHYFVKSARDKNILQFKEALREPDVLLIDDMQSIIGKDMTQKEFFGLITEYIDANKQVVLTSSVAPSDLGIEDERIISRISCGLVVQVNPNDYNLREKFIVDKLEEAKLSIDVDVIEYLAENLTVNFRQIEGAVHRLAFSARELAIEPNLQDTKSILRDIMQSSRPEVNIAGIKREVEDFFSLDSGALEIKTRSRSIARPRQVAMRLAKDFTSKSLPEIAREFGGKDHTTILYAIRKIDQLMEENQSFADKVTALRDIVKNKFIV